MDKVSRFTSPHFSLRTVRRARQALISAH